MPLLLEPPKPAMQNLDAQRASREKESKSSRVMIVRVTQNKTHHDLLRAKIRSLSWFK